MCMICRQHKCPPGCPNYTPPKVKHYCSICGQGIMDGELFLKNIDGEYIHYDCVTGIRHLLEWLGYKIETMEDDE